MSTQHLRRLTVFVDEPDPGDYYWVMIESREDASVWNDIGSSPESFSSWLAAYESGQLALLKMVDNKKTGPMAVGENENASPVG